MAITADDDDVGGRLARAAHRAAPFAVALAVAAAGPTLLLRLLVPDRSDLAGHYLAGFAGTLGLLCLTVGWRRRTLGWDVVVLVLAAIAGGVVTEATVFRLAIFDPVDFAQQSLGAVLAGATLVGRRGDTVTAAVGVVAGTALLFVGFVLAFA